MFSSLILASPTIASAETQAIHQLTLLDETGGVRGVAIFTDWTNRPPAWQLHASPSGNPPLRLPGDMLPPGARFEPGVALNGGFWDEHYRPVGVLAGEHGIFSARGHPGALVITDRDVTIGEVQPTIMLEPAGGMPPLSPKPPHLNPEHLARSRATVIDPSTHRAPDPLPFDARLVVLRKLDPAPLRFNRPTDLRVETTLVARGGSPWPGVAEHRLLVVQPDGLEGAARPEPGARYRFEARLPGIEGVVRLVTCGGPVLLRGEQVEGNFKDRRTWRTAVGLNRTDRRLIFVALRGGLDGRPGATLHEMAATLAELGASEGLNLDGGRSTWLRSTLQPRRVRSAFPLQTPLHHILFCPGEVLPGRP